LLDEIDLGNPAKIMCLQSILEGKGYFIKKTGEFVSPAAGFTVVATGNTKGKGSDDGRFIGTNVLNEAFLERFPVTFEQEYPSVAVEKKILSAVFEDLAVQDDEFVSKLVDWADIIRKTFYDGGIDEIISTRRLVHIAKAFKIFDDRMKSIDMCINRFDEDTKASFRDLYAKLDADVNLGGDSDVGDPLTNADTTQDAPF
ncbi:CbbQ/NirQ/NorQ C-terminal domain-containing protein, partial [Pseudomonadales bacterium]|nr:CbbQ/NirQ/NorQ C-terminal domain-containing protein [Pseudomonadales bacterium]